MTTITVSPDGVSSRKTSAISGPTSPNPYVAAGSALRNRLAHLGSPWSVEQWSEVAFVPAGTLRVSRNPRRPADGHGRRGGGIEARVARRATGRGRWPWSRRRVAASARRSIRRRAGGRSRSRRGTSGRRGRCTGRRSRTRDRARRGRRGCSPSHRGRCSRWPAGTTTTGACPAGAARGTSPGRTGTGMATSTPTARRTGRRRRPGPDRRPVSGRRGQRRPEQRDDDGGRHGTGGRQDPARQAPAEPARASVLARPRDAAPRRIDEPLRGARRRLLDEEPRQASLEVRPVVHACSLPDHGSRASASSVARRASIA